MSLLSSELSATIVVQSRSVIMMFWLYFQLLMPADEKLEEFWIDFNTGSQGISFYFSLADAAVQVLHYYYHRKSTSALNIYSYFDVRV